MPYTPQTQPKDEKGRFAPTRDAGKEESEAENNHEKALGYDKTKLAEGKISQEIRVANLIKIGESIKGYTTPKGSVQDVYRKVPNSKWNTNQIKTFQQTGLPLEHFKHFGATYSKLCDSFEGREPSAKEILDLLERGSYD